MHYSIAFDTDWAPQYVIDDTLKIIGEYKAKCTLFCTNYYYIKKFKDIEIAIHPNYMSGSTHGHTDNECINNLKIIFPNAIGSRSHRLYWHAGLTDTLIKNKILYDSSIMLPFQEILPFNYFGLFRIPVWWSDGYHIKSRHDEEVVKKKINHHNGVKILIFHPINIFLNSNNNFDYIKISQKIYNKEIDEEQAKAYRSKSTGIRNIFKDILDILSNKKTKTIADIYKIYSQGNSYE
jgi:hypothetical protein